MRAEMVVLPGAGAGAGVAAGAGGLARSSLLVRRPERGGLWGAWLSYLKAISERATRKRVTRIDKFVGRAICAVRRSLKGKVVGTERGGGGGGTA